MPGIQYFFGDKDMRIGVQGYGKMGRAVEKQAHYQNMQTVLLGKNASYQKLQPLNACIDFTKAEAVLPFIERCMMAKVPCIVGTTGWEAQLASARELVKRYGGCLIHSVNFSTGAQLFFQMIKKSAPLLARFGYDAAGLEIHQRHKVDAPSGTAKEICAMLQKSYPQLAFSSMRLGLQSGTHALLFDSPHDTIEMTFRSKSRDGYAKGAILAAKWSQNKTGFYAFDEIIEDIINV